jgi:cobalt-zinc-cadmium efflux system protein
MGHDHGHGHSHDHSHADERSLRIALGLTAGYLVIQVVGGLWTGSLALLSDAAHMLTDVMALVIALTAIRVGRRPADARRTFGYYRFEILAAALNAGTLFAAGGFILWEAWHRLQAPADIAPVPLLAVAFVGLLVNLASMRVLHHGASQSINMKGAYLEVWSDTLGSIAVIAGAILIYFTGWRQADPLIAAALALWVLPRAWQLLSQSVNVLLEGVPEGLELASIEEHLLAIPGVRGVHDLHVWAITSGKNSLTAHLILEEGSSDQIVQREAREMLNKTFGILHTTIQLEWEPCLPGDQNCGLHHGHAH